MNRYVFPVNYESFTNKQYYNVQISRAFSQIDHSVPLLANFSATQPLIKSMQILLRPAGCRGHWTGETHLAHYALSLSTISFTTAEPI